MNNNSNESPSLTQEDMLTDSDFRTQPLGKASDTRKNQNSMQTVDYWFGQIYLKTVIAQKLLMRADSQTSLPLLDSMLNSELGKFPYIEELRTLWQEGIDTGSEVELIGAFSPRIRYLTAIGSVLRCNDGDRSQALLRSLRTYAGLVVEQRNSEDETSPESLSQEVQSRSDTPIGIPDRDFTRILFEHANKAGWHVAHEETRFFDETLNYKCTMKLKGDTFIGYGRSKDDAKHAASKKACTSFGLLIDTGDNL